MVEHKVKKDVVVEYKKLQKRKTLLKAVHIYITSKWQNQFTLGQQHTLLSGQFQTSRQSSRSYWPWNN